MRFGHTSLRPKITLSCNEKTHSRYLWYQFSANNIPHRPPNVTASDVFPDQDPTPRATNDPWRFTPSLMDPNSFNFQSFANAPPGYYALTPGTTNALFNNQAGDLHTPGPLGAPGIAASMSVPTSTEPIHTGAGVMDMSDFQPLPPHQVHHFNPFGQAPPPPPQAYAPSHFVHQDTGYETMDQDNSPPDSDPSEERIGSIGSAFHAAGQMVGFQQRQIPGYHMTHVLPPSAERFRFNSSLNAPTAMIKHSDEIPVSYLNKGQAYSLTIVDTQATMPLAPGTKLRTFVRVSFEDKEQRQKPGVCWSLWKEGRGTSEAHKRGGKLQAVEYVEPTPPAPGDDKRSKIELESSSFDGFSVIWTPSPTGSPEVTISVRFNFLSTDFSHSKGVKGIPVRLCAKTSRLPSIPTESEPETIQEICYCKVKLFRDHGAERKLANDVAHVKKSIDKLKHQIVQAESGIKDFGKRRRAANKHKALDTQRPGKVTKHKRTWSISSASSADGGHGERTTMEDDLQFKLQTLQDMFSSTRPVSVLYLRGEDLDDPDLHPVSLVGEASPSAKPEASNWNQGSNTGSMVSPCPSSPSIVSQGSNIGPVKQPTDQPTKVSKTDADGKLSGWIDAVGVDPVYQPPQERAPKPVACFYIVHPNKKEPKKQNYYRAIYLTQRTLGEFNQRVAAKWGLDASKIVRTIHMIQGGLEVQMDDDVIRELREAQDMTLEIEDLSATSPPVKREWEMAVESSTESTPAEDGIVLRLTF